MDCENRIVEWLEEIEPFLEESYLLTLTNKGIYNRAHKDLEKVKDSIQVEACMGSTDSIEALKLSLEDGTVVTIKNPVSMSQCSCPAQNICRHIMTGLLYCKYYMLAKKQEHTEVQENGIQEQETSSQKEGGQEEKSNIDQVLPEIDVLSDAQIQKLFGKKLYQQAISTMTQVEPIQIHYGKMVTVSFTQHASLQSFTIYLTKVKTVEEAICSCKDKGLCIHKLYAIMGYLKQRHGRILEAEKVNFEWTNDHEECAKAVKDMVQQLLDRGLVNITETMIRKVEALYIKAYNQQFYEIAQELKFLSSELVLYFSANVRFSNQKVMHSLCRIYNRLVAMEHHKDQPEKIEILMGQRKLEGIEEEKLTLVGIGDRCFKSKRKEWIISAYFYCKEYKQILTVSTLRPQQTNHWTQGHKTLKQEIEYLYNMPILWHKELTFNQVIHKKITLKKALVRGEKISTTSKSQVMLEDDVTLEDIEALMISDFNTIKEQLLAEKRAYFKNYNERQHLFLIKANEHSLMQYNETLQRLECNVYDVQGEEILFYLPFNDLTKQMIDHLEKNRTVGYIGFMGQVYLRYNRLEAQLYQVYEKEKEES